MNAEIAIPLLWNLLLVSGIFLLIRPVDASPRFAKRFAQGIGWQALWVLPAVFLQAITFESSSSVWLSLALLPFFSWPVHCGGFTAAQVFETWVPDRRDTLMSDFPTFAAITLLQMGILAWVFATRPYKRFRSEGPRDRRQVLIAVFVALNALVNIQWPWWGT